MDNPIGFLSHTHIRKIVNIFMQIFVGQSRVKLDRMMGELVCHGLAASKQIVQ